MSQQFDYLKKVIDGIDKDFIIESAESMQNENKNTIHSFESENFIEIRENPKKKSSNIFIGLSAVAAAIVCVVSVGVVAVVKGNEVSIANSSAQEVSSTTDKELLNSSNSTIITDAEFLSLSEIYSTADDALLKKYDKLSLPQNITLDKVQSLYTFTADWNIKGDAEKKKNDIAEFGNVIVGEKINQSDIRYDTEKSEYLWESGAKHISCSSDLNGGYNLVFRDEEFTLLNADYIYEKLVRFDRGETAEGEYTLNGKAYSLKDATEYCNQTLEKLEQFIHPAEELRLKTLFIKKLDNGEYTYRFIAEKLINGIPLDEGCDYSNIKTGISKPSYIVLEMDAPAHFKEISTFYSNSYVSDSNSGNIKMQECNDSFISLSSACDILSNKVGMRFSIKDIDIKYIAIIGNYDEGLPPATEYCPMWTFVLNEKLTHNASPNDDTRVCAYVDMQSGALYIIDSISSEKAPLPEGNYAKENNTRVNYTRDEVKEILSEKDNFTVADNFICDVPKEIESIKEFTLMYSSRQENEDFYKDFLAMFKRIYPNEPFYEDCVFWYKETWDEEGKYHHEILPLAETMEDFLNSGNSAKYMFYSTNEKEGAERNIFLEIASPVCNDLFNFNKGVLAEYRGLSKHAFLETVVPHRAYNKVATHTADSNEKYTLLDGKEMSVKDAVKFYEDYINTLPMSHTPTTNVRVKEVDVFKCGENAYYYVFINTVSYDGINLSYLRMEDDCTSSSESCNKFIYSMGCMVVTDEVDYTYGIHRSFKMTEETSDSEIISFETAVDILSNAMVADYVVTGAELLYVPDMPADQRVVIEDYKCRTSAKWKLTLYSESDDLYYHCYVNAKDGKGFECFKTE
ncbi:MAG: hypothetical protein J6D27_10700 [Ruminiclostridium sp.]|nr:hypothetical protein [Ruminiclostridium sp.]